MSNETGWRDTADHPFRQGWNPEYCAWDGCGQSMYDHTHHVGFEAVRADASRQLREVIDMLDPERVDVPDGVLERVVDHVRSMLAQTVGLLDRIGPPPNGETP